MVKDQSTLFCTVWRSDLIERVDTADRPMQQLQIRSLPKLA